MVGVGIDAAKHFVMRQLPESQIRAGVDLLHGDGDTKLNFMKLLGPVAGFTASAGYPGGPAKGEVRAEDQAFRMKFGLAWPDIRKQIIRGDETGAREALTALGVPPARGALNQRSLMRSATNPAFISGTSVLNFYQRATPDMIQRFEHAR